MTAGRPTNYNKEIINKAQDYLDNLPVGETIHSIEGLSLHLGIARSTLYEWIKDEDKEAFSDIVSKILTKQGLKLINSGLNKGVFEASIVKVLLTKHGYREGIEQTGKDGKDLIPDEQTREKANNAITQFIETNTQERDTD